MAKSKKKNVIGIYAWVVDGTVRYIGHAHDINDSRRHNHLSKMRHGKHTKKMQALWNEINDESKWELVTIEECLVHDLLVRESYWKDYYKDTIKNTNNIKKLKKTFRTGHNAKKQKEKFSELFSGTKNPNYQDNIDKVIAIKYLLKNTDMKGKDIARFFGVNDEYVSKIKRNIRWVNILVPEDYEFILEKEKELPLFAVEAIPEEILCNDIIPQNKQVEMVTV